MGDELQHRLIQTLANRMHGPILEIGSKRYGGPPTFYDYRSLFPNDIGYVGVDMEAGEGVDVVVDMTPDIASIRKSLGGRQFQSLICLSVLEHVRDIFTFAHNVESIMEHGAMMVISVPFVWEIHAFPSDFWRFTPGAIEFLFPHVAFDSRLSSLHTDTGKTASLAEVGGDINAWIKMQFASSRRSSRPARDIQRSVQSIAKRILGLRNTPAPLHSTMFNMIGYKTK